MVAATASALTVESNKSDLSKSKLSATKVNDPAPDETGVEFLLSQMRGVRTKAQLFIADLDTIGIALKSITLKISDAVGLLREIGAIDYMLINPTEPTK